MAGRDAYLEMVFHEPVEPPKVQPGKNVASVERKFEIAIFLICKGFIYSIF